jgi:predicted GH43/DUF377 family glycosyl hydrolase
MKKETPEQRIVLKRLAEPVLEPDHARLALRPFVPRPERIRGILARVAALPKETLRKELDQVRGDFSAAHGDLEERFTEHYALALGRLAGEPLAMNAAETASGAYMAETAPDTPPEAATAETAAIAGSLSRDGRSLAGAYFTSEYAFEATALFNPSIVADPNQNPNWKPSLPGTLRFIMSVRSVGEGHVSSVSFRAGLIDKRGNVTLDPVGQTAVPGACKNQGDINEVQFDRHTPISERLIFPIAGDERGGIEDLRFVGFTQDDGTIRYYATYTAYDGRAIAPKLMETDDFLRFRMMPLRGAMAKNKGMALFPRKINGQYMMLSRMDGESLYITNSRDLQVWEEGEQIAGPCFPWEFMQIGNCGSPIELAEGWLVLTHGVGSLRRYSIGALLLDKDDPSKVIGRLADPLISPGERERTGYVPNVVYTCGAIINENRLIIPYGSADRAIAFITVRVEDLMRRLQKPSADPDPS